MRAREISSICANPPEYGDHQAPLAGALTRAPEFCLCAIMLPQRAQRHGKVKSGLTEMRMQLEGPLALSRGSVELA